MVHIQFSLVLTIVPPQFYYLIIASLFRNFRKSTLRQYWFHLRIFVCFCSFLFRFELYKPNGKYLRLMIQYISVSKEFIGLMKIVYPRERDILSCILSTYLLFTHTNNCLISNRVNFLILNPTHKTIFATQTTEAFAWIQQNLIVLLFLFNRIFRLTSSRFIPFEMKMWMLIVWYRGANERIHNVIVGVFFTS